MADQDHLATLARGVDVWNQWRTETPPTRPDLSEADLSGSELTGVNFSFVNLQGADLRAAILTGANLAYAQMQRARLDGAQILNASLTEAQFTGAQLPNAILRHSTLDAASFRGANLRGANLGRIDGEDLILAGADLRGADLQKADLWGADLSHANLAGANLRDANLNQTNLTGSDLTEVDLIRARMTGVDLSGATIHRAKIYGLSAWDVTTDDETRQRNLSIAPPGQAARITVGNIEVAQFVNLLLNNDNIRGVIDTIGAKGVLILGRFGERKYVLDSLSARLRELGFAPMVFDFEKPASKDFTETVQTLAGMSAFVVADITAPRSVPQEAQATIPNYMVPFVPIIEEGQTPWPMFKDLWIKYRDWVFEPLPYPSIDELIPKLGSAVVKPALERRKTLLARRAEEMGSRSLDDFDHDQP